MADSKGTGAAAPWLALEPPVAFGNVLSGASVAVLLLEHDGRLVHANAAAVDLLGLDTDRLLAAFTTDVLGLAPVVADLAGSPAGARVRTVRKRVLRPDGSTTLVEGRVSLAEPVDGTGSPQAVAFLHELPPTRPVDRHTDRHTDRDGERRTDESVVAADSLEAARQRRDDHLVTAQLRVLRLVATSAPLGDALAAVVELLDDRLPGSTNRVVVERDGHAALVVPPRPTPDPVPAATEPLAGNDRRHDDEQHDDRHDTDHDGHGGHDGHDIDVDPEAGGPEAGDPDPDPDVLADPADCLVTAIPAGTGGDTARILTCPQPADQRAAETTLATAVELVTIALDRDHAQRTLARRAFHDELTGLANRNLLVDRLGQALNRARRRDRPLALMFVDLDRFKAVNDTFGHDVGDAVLQQFAERLRQTVRPEDTVARFGGDEFVVLIEQIADERDVELIAERLGQRLAEPFVAGQRQLHLTASVGLVVATGDDQDLAADLLRNADVAMYRAKQLGRNRREVFDDSLRLRQQERTRLAAELRQALATDAFVLHYQPVVDLATGTVPMVEALLRWLHPERGELSPTAFLAAADDAGLLLELGDWVLRTAVAELRLWPPMRTVAGSMAAGSMAAGSMDGAGPGVRVAVNAVARQLARPDAVDTIAELLRAAGAAPARLALELPEEALVEGNPAILEAAARLRALGVLVTVDDFGTGSTALSSLRRGDVDLVKLDHRFVAALGAPTSTPATTSTPSSANTATDGQVARAVIAMAHALDLRVVAEGVETETQLAALRSLGCDLAQGLLFAPPMPADDLAGLLGRTSRW